MSEPELPPPPTEGVATESLSDKRKRNRLPSWPYYVGGVALVLALLVYSQVAREGLPVKTKGHVVILKGDPQAWMFLSNGNLVKASAESTARFALRTGTCEAIEGRIDGELLELEVATCTPGPLRRAIGERLHEAGLKWGYWAPEIKSDGDDPEPFLATAEIVANMSHQRFDQPQIVSLYWELFPGTIARGRSELGDAFPPPFVITADRNDFQLKRYTRTRLAEFLSYPRFIIGGAASAGGWLVREVVIDPAGADCFEDYLAWARRKPFDTFLADKGPLHVALRKHVVARQQATPDAPDAGTDTRPPPPGTVP